MRSELELLRALAAAERAASPLVLATVVATRGSVPRDVGSRMVVDPAAAPGTGIVGTIGGGCGEADVLRAAADVVRQRRARIVRIELTDPIDSWSPAVCGGTMEILVEPVA